MEKIGYQVLEAEDGEQGLALVQSKNVDLFISDICMPKMDGMGLLKAILSDPKSKNIKVVMLTAYIY